jgi:hypothetical protein
MGDLNGDGKADVCIRSDDAMICALSDGTRFLSPTPWRAMPDSAGWNLPQYYSTLRLSDVDGDGGDDLCGMDPSGFHCYRSDGTAFVDLIEGPKWISDSPNVYGTLRMGDLNGDRKEDVCIRKNTGLECYLSDGKGFPTLFPGPAWSDESGWSALPYWSTFRLADVNGDHRKDACIRSSTELSCVLSELNGFGEKRVVAELSDSSGWGDRNNYATFRTGDYNGDGTEDICARANSYMICWSWDGSSFVSLHGPLWSDDGGWNSAYYYETIRMSDFNGDGLEDLCARASDGWHCSASDGTQFGTEFLLPAMGNSDGGGEAPVWSTLLSGGRSCGLPGDECTEVQSLPPTPEPEWPGKAVPLNALQSGCSCDPSEDSAANDSNSDSDALPGRPQNLSHLETACGGPAAILLLLPFALRRRNSQNP